MSNLKKYTDESTGFHVVRDKQALIIKGLAYSGYSGHLRSYTSEFSLPIDWDQDLGFRVVLDLDYKPFLVIDENKSSE